MKLFIKFFAAFLLLGAAEQSHAKVVEYEFDIEYKTVNFTGKPAQAIAVGGSIPAPVISATVGDILQVTFHNKLEKETSIHWHGVLLPNDQDGVPYLTTMPIRAGASFTYRFPVKHHGTYWYHSHTGLQEQRGVYGALVFHPVKEIIKSDRDYVVVLSDWTDENPARVLANLKKDGDYYALKKDSAQSWDKVAAGGMRAIAHRLKSSWTRMGPMDISDVGYDAFLADGKPALYFEDARPGETIRLRLINAAASTYFNVEFAGSSMTIVAADGVDTQPLKVKRLRMAIAETYDVLLTLAQNKSYELRATSEDATGFASVFIGQGEKALAPDMPKPNLLLMDHSHRGHSDTKAMGRDGSSMKTASHQRHKMSGHKSYLTQYQNLKSLKPTALGGSNPAREIRLNLTGNMEGYTWSFDNKTLSEADELLIKKGENVRFVLTNKTMMHHPLHLHGHFFRALNGEGKYSPLKHTVNVPPMDAVTIEFYAGEEKDWFFHCHNLYHMKAGMARVVRYQGSQTDPKLLEAAKTSPARHDDGWFFKGEAGAYVNKGYVFLRPSNTRNAFELEAEHDYDSEYDADASYERIFTRFFSAYLGAEADKENGDAEQAAVAGIRYVLPMLIEADARVDSQGGARLELSGNLQLTKRMRFDWEWNTEGEYEFFLSYEASKNLLIGANYGDPFGGGVGAKIHF